MTASARAGVVGDDLHGVRGQVDPMLHQKRTTAVLVGAFGVGMPIQPRTDKATNSEPAQALRES